MYPDWTVDAVGAYVPQAPSPLHRLQENADMSRRESLRRVTADVDLAQYLLLGMSFQICRDLGLWPPLVTFNGFLGCGVDDVAGDSTMTWQPFEVSDHEYREAVRVVDPNAVFDSLAAENGDWKRWFEAAVEILLHRKG